MKSPYVKNLGKLKGFTIWTIDAEWLRNNLDDSFFAGGHGLYYDYIPKNEIWIEDTIDKKEMIFIIFHELLENKLMSAGMSYDIGHEIANLLEAKLRKHPDKMKEILSLI